MIRILHVLGHVPIGGVGTFLINMLEHIDKTKFKIDFVMFNSNHKSDFIDKVQNYGSDVHCFESYLKPKYIFSIKEEFESYLDNRKQYDIVHLHSPNLGIFILPIAKKKGIKSRILHSHSIKYSDNYIKSIRNHIISIPNRYYITDRIACSEEAGKFLFGKEKFFVVKNGINISKYSYNEEVRKLKRQGVQDKFIIGHVGNFVPLKNHEYLIDMFSKLNNENDKYELWLVGDGPTKKKIEEKVNQLGISKSVKFLGYRNDIEELMQAFDIFVFPSLSEGLGMVLIEAQTSGLTCLVSNNIPYEAKVSNYIKYLSIYNNHENWIKFIECFEINKRIDNSEEIKKYGYDIKDSCNHLQKIYNEAVSRY